MDRRILPVVKDNLSEGRDCWHEIKVSKDINILRNVVITVRRVLVVVLCFFLFRGNCKVFFSQPGLV